MKGIKGVYKILLITIGIAVGLYVVELAFFPKKSIQYELNEAAFKDAEFLDVHYQLFANKHASGKVIESDGWYVSKNKSKKIDGKFSRKGLFLQINEQELTLVNNKYIANKLYLVNNTDDDICFPSQDNRLYLTMQAKNAFGVWKDIEHMPNSSCGNSYYDICIGKKSFGNFPVCNLKEDTKLNCGMYFSMNTDIYYPMKLRDL